MTPHITFWAKIFVCAHKHAHPHHRLCVLATLCSLDGSLCLGCPAGYPVVAPWLAWRPREEAEAFTGWLRLQSVKGAWSSPFLPWSELKLPARLFAMSVEVGGEAGNIWKPNVSNRTFHVTWSYAISLHGFSLTLTLMLARYAAAAWVMNNNLITVN